MNENISDEWFVVIKTQRFVNSTDELNDLLFSITNLVSRDKLIEWERFAKEKQDTLYDNSIFPAVKPLGLIISITIFSLSLLTGYPSFYSEITNDVDHQASRCMSLLLFVVSLWITEAVPYFATSITIPVLVYIHIN